MHENNGLNQNEALQITAISKKETVAASQGIHKALAYIFLAISTFRNTYEELCYLTSLNRIKFRHTSEELLSIPLRSFFFSFVKR